MPGEARGPVLRLEAPISFWGGVDPETGRIRDLRHPQAGADIGGRILVVPETVGSSSSSAIMLELMRIGRAPAGLVLGAVDAILVLGVLVGRALGYPALPVLLVEPARLADLPDGEPATLTGGRLAVAPRP